MITSRHGIFGNPVIGGIGFKRHNDISDHRTRDGGYHRLKQQSSQSGDAQPHVRIPPLPDRYRHQRTNVGDSFSFQTWRDHPQTTIKVKSSANHRQAWFLFRPDYRQSKTKPRTQVDGHAKMQTNPHPLSGWGASYNRCPSQGRTSRIRQRSDHLPKRGPNVSRCAVRS